VALFDELAAALAEGGIGQPQAIALRAQLDSLRSISPGARFGELCRALPHLPVLKTIAKRELFTVRKAEGMLLALLGAIATTKPQSGTLVAVEAPALKLSGEG
jgi:hypothetical protein